MGIGPQPASHGDPPVSVVAGDEHRTVASLADPVVVFAPGTICDEVERWFVQRPDVSSVVVRDPEGRLEILTRRRLASELAGRLGHGRSLYGRRPLWALPGDHETLILDGATLLTEAGGRVLARPQGHRYDDFIVIDPGGAIGTASVAKLFGALANLHAYRAVHDRLTGLPNRELYVERLRALTGSVAGLFVDLDDFKAVNDSLGHSAGDDLLITVAERLQAIAGPDETVARLSGDEFGVLQPGGTESSARQLAERIEGVLSMPMTLQGRSVTVSASIGIAIASGDDVALLLRNADIAMYESKRYGKRRHTVYEDEMFRRASRRLELKTDIDNALALGQLHLVYQPIVSLADGATTGTEALLRWEHPRLGAIPPLDFITLAEESGAIIEIGMWVIDTACRQTRTWEREHDYKLNASVNVSSRQLARPDFPQLLRAVLGGADLEPARLMLEITESTVAADGPGTLNTMRELAELGVVLAIDDFGTGLSSLDRLERLPISTLKIDKSFVARLAEGNDARLLRGFHSLAAAMGIDTVVEGIETPEQLYTLIGLGYKLGQGFHMARPLTVEAMSAKLALERAGMKTVRLVGAGSGAHG